MKKINLYFLKLVFLKEKILFWYIRKKMKRDFL